jgi:hypothetical protein
MISKSLADLLFDLGVDKSHSRPHVSNDNPGFDILIWPTSMPNFGPPPLS